MALFPSAGTPPSLVTATACLIARSGHQTTLFHQPVQLRNSEEYENIPCTVEPEGTEYILSCAVANYTFLKARMPSIGVSKSCP